MIPAQELSFDLIPLFDAALWNLSGRTEPTHLYFDILDVPFNAHLDCQQSFGVKLDL
jgi:hypothetical protein